MQIKVYNSYDSEKHQKIYLSLFELTKTLRKTYPEYVRWFGGTFMNGLETGERLSVVAYDNKKIIGCALLKNTTAEKKICTVYVHPHFRRLGVGTCLIQKSIKLLGQTPLITVSEKKLPVMLGLLKKTGFRLSGSYPNRYYPHRIEYHFHHPKITKHRISDRDVLLLSGTNYSR